MGSGQALLDWIAANPDAAGLVVAGIAFAESLVVVGLVMPGAALLFGVGALIAIGALPFWPTLVWATVGAMAGDWLSFFIGRRYEQTLRRTWPLRKHPELLERGLRFIDRHGGKSLFLGRFVGPVRPILPALAGMLRMRTGRFLAISTFASLLWAPVYLLPGALFGASLGLASEVGGRLVVVILVLAALIWFSIVIVRRFYRQLQPRAVGYLNRAALWSIRHPALGRFTRGLIDPARPDAGTLAAWAVILLMAVWGFSHVIGSVLQQVPPTALDQALYDTLQGLRTPWIDGLMIRITHLGDITLVMLLAVTVSLWLVARRRWIACAHWLGAVAFALIVPWLLKNALAIPRPEAIAAHVSDAAFPSGHTTRGIALFGFLAVLTARDFRLAWRWLPYTVATLIALGIAASRLYLGAHWLSDVVGGLTLGLIWVTVIGIAFRRHDPTAGRGRQLSVLTLALVLIGGTIYSNHYLPRDLERYAQHRPVVDLDIANWLSTDWQRVPQVRNDLGQRHNHPFTLQWAGDPAQLSQQLVSAGWRVAHAPSWHDIPRWFGATLEDQRPVLPQIHDGSHEELALWRDNAEENERWVLRLWRVPFRLQPGDIPLYAGNVSRLASVTVLHTLTMPRTRRDFDAPLEQAASAIGPLILARVKRSVSLSAGMTWSGEVLLAGSAVPMSMAPTERQSK